jgi:hypothetical protein
MKELEKLIFRFKTREEFLKEFGDNWENEILYSWHYNMDKWLGKPIPVQRNMIYLQLWFYDIEFIPRESYSISRDMIKPIKYIENDIS